MKLTAPKNVTFWISVALAALGLIAQIGVIPAMVPWGFWLLLVGFVLLAVSLMVKGL